jgi:hypothetical protein
MKDYEQLYYDQKYQIKQLKNKIKQLEEELEIYRMVGKDKSIRNLLIKDISKYIVKKSKMIENDRK